MKGISLSINVVIGMVVVALVLVVVSFFFATNTVTQMTAAEATKVFNSACVELKCGTPTDLCKENMIMESLHTNEFEINFFKACNILYGGSKSNAFLCFEMCGNCIKPAGQQLTDFNTIRDKFLQKAGSDQICYIDLSACAEEYCTI